MDHPEIITLGKRNATFQVFQSLRNNRNSRHREKCFIVEGIKALNQLSENNWKIKALLVQDGSKSVWSKHYIKNAEFDVMYEVSPELMAELSDKNESSEIMALTEIPELHAAALPVLEGGIYVVADHPNSPGNLGSLIRTAEAFGAKAVLSYGHAVDFFDQKTISSSIGTVFSISIAHLESGDGFNAWVEKFRSAGISVSIVALDEKGDVDCGSLNLKGACIIVVGNETDGLSKVFRDRCDIKVRIPMVGSATSLNAACSGSILLYQLLAR